MYRKQIQYKQIAALYYSIEKINPKITLPYIKDTKKEIFKPSERINIHINTYLSNLLKVVTNDFPVTAAVIGSFEFNKLAKKYVIENPSKSWDLNIYSVKFAEFLKMKNQQPNILDIAKFESSIVEVFWSKEEEIFSISDAIKLNEDTLGRMKFNFRKQVKIIELQYKANNFVSKFSDKNSNEKLNINNLEKLTEYIAVIRYNTKLSRELLDKEEYMLLSFINSGYSLNHSINLVTNTLPLVTQR